MSYFYKTNICKPIMLFVLLSTPCLSNAEISSEMFRHHYIFNDLPGDEVPGSGCPALGDFDGDGDMDFAASDRRGNFYWFENEGKSPWKRHALGKMELGQLGCATLDVDGDGWVDILIGGYWYRNPQNPREQEFERYTYDNTIKREIHDMVIADINGDGKLDVVVLGDGDGCFWYEVPEEPKKNENWPRHTITLEVLDSQDDIHGGFFPAGIGDLDMDGDADVVMPDRWYSNENKGQEWVRHDLPWGKRGPWGLSCRSWIVDMDQDGDADIVVTDADQSGSRAAWLENNGAEIPEFQVHMLPLTAEGTRGSFHTLAVVDFDQDGDVDIFTVEQEDTQILPKGAPPRWFIWENLDGKGGKFVERIILDQATGGHDALVADVDGDGDLDICTKIWGRWKENGNQGREHGDFLENLTVR